ncbi:hypothetical protein PR048_033776 [Dryococelus australis]|uniref:Uncharacterized protein n=1 Tax=Dryococelus australis TaxID=614101 RepID=A0ABQ9FZ08_9NEOP|nr:hypothetical protein PR048_033776 [Dryococelus australis]
MFLHGGDADSHRGGVGGQETRMGRTKQTPQVDGGNAPRKQLATKLLAECPSYRGSEEATSLSGLGTDFKTTCAFHELGSSYGSAQQEGVWKLPGLGVCEATTCCAIHAKKEVTIMPKGHHPAGQADTWGAA